MYGFELAVFLKSGEIVPVREVIRQQMTRKRLVLYGPAYSDKAVYFKHQAVLSRSPEIVVIGGSRAMQFRSNFFKDAAIFYNAGGGVRQLEDFKLFLETIPKEKSPRLIMIGLEHFYFNPNWAAKQRKTVIDEDISAVDIVFGQLRFVFKDYMQGKFCLRNLTMEEPGGAVLIGVNAIIHHNGFRNDGSYFYGKAIADKTANPSDPGNDDLQFQDTLGRIARGTNFFEYGDHVSTGAVAELDALLKFCKQRDIYVIGFLPPYAQTIYNRLASMPDKYGYLSEIVPSAAPVFKRHGYSFYDFSDLTSVGSSDLETVDGFHATEKAYLRLFIVMATQSAPLMKYARDPVYLQKRLDGAAGPCDVFSNSEL